MRDKRRIQAMTLALALALSVTHLQAVNASTMSNAKDAKKEAEADLNNTKRQIEEIERQQTALQNEIDQKDAELVNLLVNVGILEDELNDKNVQLDQVTDELAEAEQTEAEQYASMKKRIQFMYERGDTAMIEAILGSADMSDFLNRVEYVSDIYEYDRNLLTQYQNTVRQVADLKSTVETEKAELEAMQEEYALQQEALEQVLADKRSRMGDYDNQLTTAQAAAAKFRETIAAQNQIIKEEERKQREAIAAAEAAARERERERANRSNANDSGNNNANANNNNTNADNNNTNGGGSGGNAGGGAGNSGSDGGGANPGYSTNVSGSAVVAYATQFVGNPYVWGGTSLTNGADCSGFVMSVFAHFGISLPHSSAALQGCGKAVSYANAQPGDLICYSGHVGIYMGGGRIVHAQSTAVGITTSSAAYRTIVAVRRVL